MSFVEIILLTLNLARLVWGRPWAVFARATTFNAALKQGNPLETFRFVYGCTVRPGAALGTRVQLSLRAVSCRKCGFV